MFICTQPYSWLEISKSSFNHNIRTYKSIIGPNKKVAVVIKANAYGHGTVPIGQLCQSNQDVDWICTSNISEALLLRKTKVTKPILVMSCLNDNPEQAIIHKIDLIGSDINQICMLNKIAKQHKKPINIHIKIDTGMSRFGFSPNELLAVIDKIKNLSHVKINGIFTHCSDTTTTDQSYTYLQYNRFKKIIFALRNNGIEIPFRHIAATAATTTIPLEETTMIRLGAGAFGLCPSIDVLKLAKQHYPTFKLKPILTWKTRIIHIKTIPTNTYVGYGRTYKTNNQTQIGILPIGYYDGLDLRLSSKGNVYLTKQQCYAPIIGKICMNTTIINLNNISNLKEGDEVILIGNYTTLTAEAIAQTIECSNPRQIPLPIAPHLPRIIVP